MVRTQAKATQKYLNKARDIILDAIRNNNKVNLQVRLQQQLDLMPQQALVLVNELAKYEAKYTYDKLRKYAPRRQRAKIVQLPEARVETVVESAVLNTSTNKPNRTTIRNTYARFAQSKARQYMQMVNDAELLGEDAEETEAFIKERTRGLFTTQNLALAGLAIATIANRVRDETAKENLLMVNWVLDLELNNCPDCEAFAANSPYDPAEVEDEIQVHTNCGCALVPIFDALDV